MTQGLSPGRRPFLSDTEFQDELEIVANEVYEGVFIYHTMEAINDLALHDENVFIAMNEQPMFWKAHRAAFQTSLFMCLGRIFDINDRANSIHRLVRIARENFQLFSNTALAARKSRSGPKPSWLDDYIASSWAPQAASDLKFLKNALKPHIAEFETVYKPIRDKIYGHRLMSDEQAGIDFFPQTNRETIGKTLDFLHILVEAINELFVNGKQPVLERDFTDYNNQIREGARKVLQRLAEHAKARKFENLG